MNKYEVLGIVGEGMWSLNCCLNDNENELDFDATCT